MKLALWFVLVLEATCLSAALVDVEIKVSSTRFLMGRSTRLFVNASDGTYWPFVNGTQWGAFCTIALGRSNCSILLPVPRAGKATVLVAKLPRLWCQVPGQCMFPVGTALPQNSPTSNVLQIEVVSRELKPPASSQDVCIDWEPWFTKDNLGGKPWLSRPGAEGVPLVGLYGSFNADVVRQHAIWFAEAGVNCILVDWSNNLWSKKKWADRSIGIQELINATTFALQEYASMREESLIAPPKAVIMIGYINGPPAAPSALQDEAAWIHTNYIETFGVDHFLQLDGRPVLVILDTRDDHPPRLDWNVSKMFSVRWMGTQLQDRPALGQKEGFWSWMDGSYEPVVAMHSNNAEALTVTPGFFNSGGWLGQNAAPYNNGATFVKTMESAMRTNPSVLLVCQWNEFAGQPGGPPGQYVDSYNVSLTNDMEPISLSECAYVRPGDKGRLPICDSGWGFFSLNLLKASLATFRGVKKSTVIRILSPMARAPVLDAEKVNVTWTTIGDGANGPFLILVDGNPNELVKDASKSALLNLKDIAPGKHTLSVVALDGWTRFQLSRVDVDDMLETPKKNATASVVFEVTTIL